MRRSEGDFVTAFDGRYYRISNVEMLPAFFMNIVSASDLWLFLASNGGLTAGRRDADLALFPYAPVDQLYDRAGLTGPSTLVRTPHAGRTVCWEPFAAHTPNVFEISRHLYKSVEGDRVWFEEINHTLKLAFRSGWATAESYGFVRRAELANLSSAPREIELLDALRNLLPPGVLAPLQAQSSCLVDAYKTAERCAPDSTLAVYALATGIIDRAIALESLRSSIAWSNGLPDADVILTEREIAAFRDGAHTAPAPRARGVRSVYGLRTSLTLAPEAASRWMMVADIGLTQPQVAATHAALRTGELPAQVEREIAAGTKRLRALIGSSDGLHAGRDELLTVHHYANTLFNVMRGGVFAEGHVITMADFTANLRERNPSAAARHERALEALPARLTRAELLARASALGDVDLTRLASEYLPLTFSRRHGDPSRPWNKFRIHVRDERGGRVLAHEGNWRDIFQNWEATCLAFPDFFDAVISKFLNASTADGYNPYRVSHLGIDWEVPEPENPWASIGYWGDHQVIYLQRLLEWSGRIRPAQLHVALRDARFSYAAVPYRIAPFDEIVRNPHETIRFDAELHRALLTRERTDGTDAKLLRTRDGAILHVNLTEKLLLLVLTRLTNFVPGGGIWMNTQRPEWNDANNALVGYGVSFVTLCYLRRLVAHALRELLPALGDEPVAISSNVAHLLDAVQRVLETNRARLVAPIDDTARLTLLTALGRAGSDYRERVYSDGLNATTQVAPAAIRAHFETALAWIDHTLRSGVRADGLYESYSQLEFTSDALRVRPLQPMLEGQVAILSAGLLTPADTVALLTRLRTSPLYRADQHSYLLYPDRELPAFLERNRIAPERVDANPLLAALVLRDDARLIVRDVDGHYRFHADLVNADALEARLAELRADGEWQTLATDHATAVHAIYEEVFHHRAFTGRSGAMFGYEGLGCIYWHMVAKLLLAVQENLQHAEDTAAPEAAQLHALYSDVRAGLGFNKTPADYGAFPTDPYSHTPGHSGAQQPGMTGQVKEEILTRAGELGIRIRDGVLSFEPTILSLQEFTTAPTRFAFIRADGTSDALELAPGSFAFTWCGTPIVYQLSDDALQWTRADGSHQRCVGRTLPRDVSAAIFARDGSITAVDVKLGRSFNGVSS